MEQNTKRINLYRETINAVFNNHTVDPIVKEVILSLAILTKGKNLKITRVGDKRCGNYIHPNECSDVTRITFRSRD